VRPVDAEALEKKISEWLGQPGNGDYYSGYDAALCAVQDLIADTPTITQPNEPLTLEVLAKSQLLQMLGEKVEVIRMGEMCQAEWATVRSFGDCKTDSGCLCCHELYGKTWIAYRRPPEGEEEKP